MARRILLVEDDLNLAALIRYNLTREGYEADLAATGKEGLRHARAIPPDLVLLDWMLPDISGIEVCKQLKADPATAEVPVIMVTARGEEADRVRGLGAGADDYVTKPFSPRELFARIDTILRRSRAGEGGDILRYDDIMLDTGKLKTMRGGRLVHLGPTEFRLLRHFMQHPCRVFTREQLREATRREADDSGQDIRTVDQHIRRLRKALNARGEKDLIRTVRMVGYAIDSDSGEPADCDPS